MKEQHAICVYDIMDTKWCIKKEVCNVEFVNTGYEYSMPELKELHEEYTIVAVSAEDIMKWIVEIEQKLTGTRVSNVFNLQKDDITATEYVGDKDVRRLDGIMDIVVDDDDEGTG